MIRKFKGSLRPFRAIREVNKRQLEEIREEESSQEESSRLSVIVEEPLEEEMPNQEVIDFLAPPEEPVIDLEA